MIAINLTATLAPWADVAYGCDGAFWRTYQAELAPVQGERWTLDASAAAELGMLWIEGVDGVGLSQSPRRIFTGGSSGYQAIGLAYLLGAARIILLGYDMQRSGRRAHWHPDHPVSLGNPGPFDQWVARFRPLANDLRRLGVQVVNASRATALDAFPRMSLEEALSPRVPLLVEGMLGAGDNIHQRALVREWVKTRDVWLRTPWPSLYTGIDGVRFLPPVTNLRTQAKNAAREQTAYSTGLPPRGTESRRIWYTHDGLRRHGGFMQAMAAESGVKGAADFSLTVPHAWKQKAGRWLQRWQPTRPLMLYRPLVERTEWSGCAARNPDHDAYHALAASVRDRFFVVSVADLQRGKEWAVGTPLRADVDCHAGELDVETLAALAAGAGLVFCSPGFMLVLAQAVRAPLCAVFGGHEAARLYDHGQRTDLFIEPVTPCCCFRKDHACDKRIDLAAAKIRLQEFTQHATHDHPAIPA